MDIKYIYIYKINVFGMEMKGREREVGTYLKLMVGITIQDRLAHGLSHHPPDEGD